MKLFRKLFLLVPLMFSLASCGSEKTPVGTYSFQLGSDTGTHAGIHLTLTDEEAELDSSTEETGKKFSLKFDFGASSSSGVMGIITHLDTVIEFIENHAGVDISSLDELVDKIQDAIDQKGDQNIPITLPGYYYFKDGVNAKSGKTETRLMMGIDFNFIPDMPVQIPASLVEMIMYAVYDGDNINVIVPVSLEDLLYQIYWYGYRIAGLKSLTNPVDLNKENPYIKHHDVGSHPTSEDVEMIQTYQKKREQDYNAGDLKEDEYETGEFFYNTYHDYHTLTMGLAKDGK